MTAKVRPIPGMKPRALVVRRLRDGFAVHLSNNPMPRVFKAPATVDDAAFDLEMEGYDVSRIMRAQSHKSVTRYAR